MQTTARTFLSTGGLAHISSLPGGSKTELALSLISSYDGPDFDPPSPHSLVTSTPYALFVADEGFLYPPALFHGQPSPFCRLSSARLLLVKVGSAEEAWRVGLEAAQLGIFSWVFLRPSHGCSAVHLRKMQLAAEKTKARVLILSQAKLPHWMFKMAMEASPLPCEAHYEKNLVFPSHSSPSPRTEPTPARSRDLGELRARLKTELEAKLKGAIDSSLRRSLSGTYAKSGFL